jgi:hypothetical protein
VRLTRLLIAIAALGLAGRVYAQDMHPSPYSETVYNEGPGFRLGSALVLHPGIAAEFGYDSNVFYSPVATGSGLMRLRAHLDLATLPPEYFNEGDNSVKERKIDFRLSAQGEYREYLTTNNLVQQQRTFNILALGDLVIMPTGPFTVDIADNYIRTIDPRNFETTDNFTRDFNRASVTGTYKGPGDGFEIGVGDYFELNLWESGPPGSISPGAAQGMGPTFANNLKDEGQLFAKWRMLPRTFLSALVRVGWIDYTNNSSLNAIPVRAVVGFSTLFSTWFGASVTAGYGNSINANGPSYNMFIGGADVRFFLPYRSQLSVVYDRDFYDSMFANYFVDDHVGLLFHQPLLTWLSADFEGGVRFRHYDGLTTAPVVINALNLSPTMPYTTGTTRDDLIYTVRAEVMFRATKWLAFAVNYNLIGDPTTFAFNNVKQGPIHVDYIKHSVFGRIDVAY